MRDKLKILIAEDTKIARDILNEAILECFTAQSYAEDEYSIHSCDSFQKSLNRINESESSLSPYDLAFIDIDFTEDNKGGKRDSGFQLIERLFTICPITQVCTYSGQFRAKDLWPGYEALKNRGLVVNTFDKSHGEAGDSNWLQKGVITLLKSLRAKQFLKEIWMNHQAVMKGLETLSQTDQFEKLKATSLIRSNLDAVTALLTNVDRFDAKEILYKIVIQYYQYSLDTFLGFGHPDNETRAKASNNKANAEQLLGYSKPIELNDRISALHTLIAYSSDDFLPFGIRLNKFRNDSVHVTSFHPDLANVLFANLVLTLFVSGKTNCYTHAIETLCTASSIGPGSGIQDLKKLLNFISK